MPNQPRDDNPSRTVRVEDPLWDESKECAEWNDESISRVVRRALKDYVRKTRVAQAAQARAEAEAEEVAQS